mgnify:CR=1 FL=1
MGRKSTKNNLENMTNLTCYILWHDDSKWSNIPDLPYLVNVNLSNLPIGDFQRNTFSESRFFLHNAKMNDYVGNLTASWNTKYNNLIPLNRLCDLEFKPNIVWAACKNLYPNWFNLQVKTAIRMHNMLCPFFKQYPDGPSLWANNFLCSREVYEDFILVWRKVFAIVCKRIDLCIPYGIAPNDSNRKMGYIGELITLMYFASRKDLEIKQIPKNTAT